MARKREEKSRRKDDKQKHKPKSTSENSYQDKDFVSVKQQLSTMGLTLREIPGDGNCLFGALADQLDGTPKSHQKHRQNVVSYMMKHREDFEPFVEDDIPFERHLSNLSELGTYGGNECIVAFARLSQVKVVIHQLNAPLWQITGNEGKSVTRELHISYHNGDHYNSVRRIGDNSANPANIKLNVLAAGETDKGAKSSECKPDDLDYYYQNYSAEDDQSQYTEDDSIEEIMKRTNCCDEVLVRKFLQASKNDTWEAIDALLNHQIHRGCDATDSGERVPDMEAAEVFNVKSFPKTKNKSSNVASLQAKLKNQPHISNAKRKEMKKQLRKEQSHQRKRYGSGEGCSESETGPSEIIVVKDMECLSI